MSEEAVGHPESFPTPPQSMRFLGLYAHPDDETFCSGGTFARYAQQGAEIMVISATRGQAGQIRDASVATRRTIGQVREQELRAAMRELGVEDVRFLDYRDSGMAGTPENDHPDSLAQAEPMEVAMDLTALMQEIYPDVVLTWDPNGGYGHPDHVKVHETTAEAFGSYQMRSGQPVRLYYMALPVHLFGEVAQELRAQDIEWGNQSIRETAMQLHRPPVTTEIDVRPYVEQKRRAMAQHRSQIPIESFFDKLSEGLQSKLVGVEYFHRAVPPWNEGEPKETSLFG